LAHAKNNNKSNVKREIEMVWVSVLSNQQKKKKETKSKELGDIYDTL